MAVEKAVRDILVSSTGVTSIVASRVYSGFVPQEVTMPFIMFRRDRTERNRSLDGPSGLVAAEIEVNCISQSAAQLQSLADAVRLALDNYSGTNKGITVHRSFLDDESDDTELEVSGGDERVRRRALDFVIWFYETAA